jgi:hypothetical protein
MEIILTALIDAFKLSAMLLCIILPLSVAYEFLKNRKPEINKRTFSVFGITHRGIIPLVAGIVIGLTYGAGVIIHSIRSTNMKKREAFLVLLFLSVCHAMIEDTLIFVVIGANGLVLIIARFLLAVILTYLMYRSKLLSD